MVVISTIYVYLVSGTTWLREAQLMNELIDRPYRARPRWFRAFRNQLVEVVPGLSIDHICAAIASLNPATIIIRS